MSQSNHVYINLNHWSPVFSTGLYLFTKRGWKRLDSSDTYLLPNSIYKYVSLCGEIMEYFKTEDFPLERGYYAEKCRIDRLTELEFLVEKQKNYD